MSGRWSRAGEKGAGGGQQARGRAGGEEAGCSEVEGDGVGTKRIEGHGDCGGSLDTGK
jgi:hypothetical protein